MTPGEKRCIFGVAAGCAIYLGAVVFFALAFPSPNTAEWTHHCQRWGGPAVPSGKPICVPRESGEKGKYER